jgi:hypothetical protein
MMVADDPNDVATMLARILARTPGARDMEALGRYLFACLIGDEFWAEMQARADGSPMELALKWARSEWELGSLPWEMMHGPQAFLAADPQRDVAITRLVADAPVVTPAFDVPIKVLFVVGASIDDASIRPGAEYLPLLRKLEARGLDVGINARVLLGATSEAVEEELIRFGPSIVQFICHGEGPRGKASGSIELVSNEDPSQKDRLGIDRLRVLLKAGGKLPSAVVLNTCYLGGTAAAQEAVPMAAELVAEGIPIAVGMAGRVADRACRLFTRGFYVALLSGLSIPAATAEGRRAGIVHLGNPTKSVDWAFPTLLMAESAPAKIEIDDATRNGWIQLERIAERFRTVANPPVFCDRLDFLEDLYRELVGSSPKARRVLAIKEEPAEQSKFGKTRLLEEMAAQATRDGHVPCLVSFEDGKDKPTNLLQLALAIWLAVLTTRDHFFFNTLPDSEVVGLVQRHLGEPNFDPDELGLVPYQQKIIQLYQRTGDLVAAEVSSHRMPVSSALRQDLSALVLEAGKRRAGARVVVLIDEVHRFDAAAADLVAPGMLDATGLGTDQEPVPVVFAFTSAKDAASAAAVEALTDFLGKARSYVIQDRILGPFSEPSKDPLPYRQFLLHYTPRLVIGRDADPMIAQQMLERLHVMTKGIPSMLESPNESVEALISLARELRPELLEIADDDDLLEELGRSQGGRV